jgi:hypothetical protein
LSSNGKTVPPAAVRLCVDQFSDVRLCTVRHGLYVGVHVYTKQNRRYKTDQSHCSYVRTFNDHVSVAALSLFAFWQRSKTLTRCSASHLQLRKALQREQQSQTKFRKWASLRRHGRRMDCDRGRCHTLTHMCRCGYRCRSALRMCLPSDVHAARALMAPVQ